MKHYNNSITEDLNLKLNPKGDMVSNEVLDYITPTIEVNPRINIVRNQTTGNTGTNALYTTPTDKDFYLSTIGFSFIKDAVCDSATGDFTLSAFIDGTARVLIGLPIITLTAQTDSVFVSFPIPIKIDRGTQMNFTGTFGAGVCRRHAFLTGYVQETTKGV